MGGRDSSCQRDLTAVAVLPPLFHRTGVLVQTGCKGKAFQGRGAEPGEYNAHPPIPTCKTLPGDGASPSK